MKRTLLGRVGVLLLGAIALVSLQCSSASAQPPVLQRGYDANVTGATLSETTLTTSNVTPSTFGLMFKLPVDDTIFAQPLYVPNVTVANQGTHNVVYVATMSDTLYAFDANVGGTPLWSVNFASRVGASPVPIANFTFSGNRNIVGNLGILSTPVIDPSTNIMYLVACTLENNTMAYRLHAVDITSGAEPYGPGVLISGSYGGSTFEARFHTQRVSLALSGNQVVFGFGAIELEYSGGYVGWVMAYNKQTLLQNGIFATVTTGGMGGGVWQSGRPPAVDSSGYVYVFTGNGWGGGYDGVHDFSESVLKLDPANGLKLLDWFTPGNWSTLDAQDADLASSGPLLIPNTSLLAGGGKTGDLYVLNTGNLGKYNATDSQVVQKLHISASEFRGGPVYWQRSAANGGPLLYNWGVSDGVKAYAFNGTKFASSPGSQGGGTQVWPGGILTLSANGEQTGSGVLWATVVTSGNAEDNPPAPGELRAFNAENLSQELWNSSMNASRDGLGNFAKFVPPLVANGKVYVASWSKQVVVYGLLNAPDTTPPSVPTILRATAVTATSITLGWNASTDNVGGTGVGGYYVYRNGNTTTPYATVTSGTSFIDSGLTATTTYTYQVAAFDKASPTANVSAASTPALSVTTLTAPDTIPPSVPTGLRATAVTANSVTLGWSASTDNVGGTGVGGYYVYRNGNTTTPYATVTSGTAFLDSGLAATTTYTYQVAAFDKATPTANVSAASTPALSVTTPSSPPPSVWSGADVGSVAAAGSYSLSSGTFTVNGSGSDIWYNADGFQFVSQPLTGDGSIIARVVSQTNTNSWAKAGVMFRETLAGNSTFAAFEVTPGNGAVYQARTTTGIYAVSTQGPTTIKAPYWVQVVRAGNVFTGSISPDGITWTTLGNYTIAMAAQVNVGLAVTSHADGVLSTAVFDNVTVTATAPH